MFKIRFLDHVAIRAHNIELSANWYEKVLGLKKYTLSEWGPFPIFMLSGKTGIAIFPAKMEFKGQSQKAPVFIDHFAFNVGKEDFEKAKNHFRELDIHYDFQDHHYFHSIYIKDLDGHTVELTTIVVDEESFYK